MHNNAGCCALRVIYIVGRVVCIGGVACFHPQVRHPQYTPLPMYIGVACSPMQLGWCTLEVVCIGDGVLWGWYTPPPSRISCTSPTYLVKRGWRYELVLRGALVAKQIEGVVYWGCCTLGVLYIRHARLTRDLIRGLIQDLIKDPIEDLVKDLPPVRSSIRSSLVGR